jgi:hypothetical protein
LQEARDVMLTPSARDVLRSNGITTTPSAVSSQIRNVPLRQTEETRYQQLANRYIDEAIHRAAAAPNFRAAPQETKQRMMDNAISQARERAAAEIIQSIGGPNEARRRLTAGAAR